jgi:hypothetical protein
VEAVSPDEISQVHGVGTGWGTGGASGSGGYEGERSAVPARKRLSCLRCKRIMCSCKRWSATAPLYARGEGAQESASEGAGGAGAGGRNEDEGNRALSSGRARSPTPPIVRNYSPTPPLPGHVTPPLPSVAGRTSPAEPNACNVSSQACDEESPQIAGTPVLPQGGARVADEGGRGRSAVSIAIEINGGGSGVGSAGRGRASQEEDDLPASPCLPSLCLLHINLKSTLDDKVAHGQADGDEGSSRVDTGPGEGEDDDSRVDTPVLPPNMATATAGGEEQGRDDIGLQLAGVVFNEKTGLVDAGAQRDCVPGNVNDADGQEADGESDGQGYTLAHSAASPGGFPVRERARERERERERARASERERERERVGGGGAYVCVLCARACVCVCVYAGHDRVSGAAMASIGCEDPPRRSQRKSLRAPTRLSGVLDAGRDSSPRRWPSPIPWRRRREGEVDHGECGECESELMLEPTLCLALPDGRIVQVPVTRRHFFSTLLDPLLGDYPSSTLLLVYRCSGIPSA